MSRREFLLRTGTGTVAAGGSVAGRLGVRAAASAATPGLSGIASRGVSIVCGPGDPVASAVLARGATVKLRDCHAHQAEAWRDAAMPLDPASGGDRATIPGDYANSPYPVKYYFEVVHPAGTASLSGIGRDPLRTALCRPAAASTGVSFVAR